VEINIEKIIEIVTKQVVKDLQAKGIKIKFSGSNDDSLHALRTKTETIDMSKYRTPVLTENHIRRLHELTGEIVVPRGTVITPKAKEMIKEKRLVISYP
jgi:hypothetical protein